MEDMCCLRRETLSSEADSAAPPKATKARLLLEGLVEETLAPSRLVRMTAGGLGGLGGPVNWWKEGEQALFPLLPPLLVLLELGKAV